MATKTRPGSFSQKLRAALDERGMGAKTLARALVREHGGTVEGRRRTIINWLQGATPFDYNREIVEDVLGMERDSLCDDEEDESSLRNLDAILRERVRVLVERELAGRK